MFLKRKIGALAFALPLLIAGNVFATENASIEKTGQVAGKKNVSSEKIPNNLRQKAINAKVYTKNLWPMGIPDGWHGSVHIGGSGSHSDLTPPCKMVRGPDGKRHAECE